MSAKTISILNSPVSGDVAPNPSVVLTITGLSPIKTGTMQSLQIQRNLVSTPQKWRSSFTAGSQICAFTLQQTVNKLLKAATFKSTGTTTSAVMSELNAFFGATATYGSATFTTSTEFDVEYRYASDILNIKGTTENPICSVTADVSNTSTISSDMSLTLSSQAQTLGAGVSILFKSVAHGLATGNTIYVGTLTGQTNANNKEWRVVYVSADTFNLVDPVTLSPVLTDGTTTSPAGSVTLVAQPEFGTPSYVDADAKLNGSAQVTTQTTYNYSAVDIVPFYTSDVAPNPSMRTAPCRVWIPDAGATTAVSSTGQSLLSTLAALVV